ncbi:helix-turn-helix domain-containing protein [Cronobacter dublinensis]|uniref:Right origin-binding protein n=1 Tax=Cronobacter dublinensis 1210 TaxID=1208656 RepID=A0ABP1WDX2_9ENTR|nr:AraC family transcriptional regulator [Cronobacter dublinensis]CCJ82628.1 Right origin-binding protein [Cronobacter dublinensis 1210]ALB68971.1 hypothetical protein AFK67_20835 [Cronobacter dublinensis subsp. dublinensis LMG 23823]EKP4478115.1 helix-turn-helix transcriptional regulator [Cronobacter dublinensis]EKY3225292.1 helix-turn-helix transcriptional regulator [Cronobacter dublinensis]ELQ6126452.1 helix-turn-helix transcriptional regulator [Cronobacter dublinensis]
MDALFFETLIAWIENNLEENLTIDRLASKAGYSKWHLQRGFKMHTGMTVGFFIVKKRMEKALVELANGDDAIITIALKNGYGSHQTFTRAFTLYYGVSPGRYRRRNGKRR